MTRHVFFMINPAHIVIEENIRKQMIKEVRE